MSALVAPAAFAKGHGPKPVKVTCTTLAGTDTTTATLTGCSQAGTTGGSGTFPGSVFATSATSGDATVTWTGTGSTSFHYTTSLPQSGKCGTGGTEAILHGAVSGNSPSTFTGVKGAVHAKVCIDSLGNLSLLNGSGPFKI